MSVNDYLDSFRQGLSAESYWAPLLYAALLAAGGCRVLALFVRPRP